jgi:hypothetical protein
MAQRTSDGTSVNAAISRNTTARRVATMARRDTGSDSRYSRPRSLSSPVPASLSANTGQITSIVVLNHRTQT